MKYKKINLGVDQKLREAVNKNILVTVAQSGNEISKDEIINGYTGKGGLHGRKFSDYDCFYDYTAAKKEIEFGEFYTPFDVVKKIVEVVSPSGRVLDPVAGKGMFANFVDQEDFTGVEIDRDSISVGKYLFPEAIFVEADIQYWRPETKFDYILTNPPFNLRWIHEKTECSSQYFILKKSIEWLRNYGIFAAVVPATYLQDEMYFKKDIEAINENCSWIGQVELPLDTFKPDYGIQFATKVIFFQKCKGENFNPGFNTWEAVEAVMKKQQEIRKQNILSVIQSEASENDYSYSDTLRDKNGGYSFQSKKLIYEIKQHRKPEQYIKALALIEKFQKQERDWRIPDQEWSKIALTEGKVLANLRKLAGFKPKKKRKAIIRPASTIQVTPFEFIQPSPELTKYVNKYRFINKFGTFQLNEIQQLDTARLISKPYAILNAEQGTGKTPQGYAVAEYRNVKKRIIISTSTAVDITWKNHLTFQGKTFKKINNISDIDMSVDYWLFSFDILSRRGRRFQKVVKGKLRKMRNNVQVIIDESDEMSNRSANRYKAIRAIFVKARYKLLTTGTITRNSIQEAYSQLEFLYNNSMNMQDHCRKIYTEIKNRGEEAVVKEKRNDNYGKPFSGWKGLAQFKRCFSPSKTSVFGIKKTNQDLYNYPELRRILSYSSIVRTFKEVAGDKYEIKHQRVKPSFSENMLYEDILERFREIVYQHYNNTGNSRKESGLRLLRQMQLMIKACSMPTSFPSYSGLGSTKKAAILEKLKSRDEKTMVGCLTLEAAQSYFESIQELPDRKVWLITGKLSSKKREAIINDFEKTENGIIVSTQQSLKSSLNIPSCNLVILESIDWNLPKIMQYAFRAIRFDSKGRTEICFITLANTIDDNLIGLLSAKERVNKAIKFEESEMSEIVEGIGFDNDFINDLITREYEEDSKGNKRIKLAWGSQKVVS